MIARFTFSVLLGAVLVAAALLSIGAASPDQTAFAAADVTTASSTIAPPVADPPQAHKPSDALHNPIDDLGGAIDDAKSARRHGWPLLALVGLVLVSRGLAKARKRWPDSRALGWMGGRVGLVVIGSGMVGAAAFDALVLGGSWVAAAYAAIGAALSLLDPEPQPSTGRQPQRGAVAGPMLAILMGVSYVAAGTAMWSCSAAQRRALVEDLVDCTAPRLSDLIAGVKPFVESALEGDVDGSKLLGLLAESSAGKQYEPGESLPPALEVVTCAAVTTISRRSEPPPGMSMREAVPAPLVTWERFRAERLSGRRFRTATGTR